MCHYKRQRETDVSTHSSAGKGSGNIMLLRYAFNTFQIFSDGKHVQLQTTKKTQLTHNKGIKWAV